MTRKEAEIKIEQLNEAKVECDKLMKELNVQGRLVDEYYQEGTIINGNQIVVECEEGECGGIFFAGLVEFEEEGN